MDRKKKAGELLDLIVASKNHEDALATLNKALEMLYLTSDYTYLVGLKDKLTSFQEQFKTLSTRYDKSEKRYCDIDEIRTDCAFLYREINDELSFDINRLKIHHEEDKTARRYDAMVNMKDNEHFKAASASAARDLVGGDAGYREYIALASMSYGLWKEHGSLLDSIKLFTDALASRAKSEFEIETRDVK